jgi:predicted benzoate:H+ symporter BenE
MAITANRYVILVLLFVTASTCYIIGFTAGFWGLLAVGAVLECAFWFKLFFRDRRG